MRGSGCAPECGSATPWSPSAADPPPPERRSCPGTQRRVGLAPALWPTALSGSVSDTVVVVVRRGPLAERLPARGLPAEAREHAKSGLAPAWAAASPGNGRRWRRGRARRPGACGWAARARRASAPSPAEHPSRDGLVQGRSVFAGQQKGWVARVPGGRQAGVARPRQGGGSAVSLWLWSAGRPAGRAGRTGCRPEGERPLRTLKQGYES